MLLELNNFLALDSTHCPTGKFIAVLENANCDAAFCLHHFISYSQKAGSGLLLITLQQSFSHYNNVASKLGVNLSLAKQNGNVISLDLMTEFKSLVVCENDNHETIADSLKNIYKCIDEKVGKSSGKSLVLFDDISMLMCLGFDQQVVAQFVHHLNMLIKKNSERLTLVIGSKLLENDTQADWLCKYLQHTADLSLSVSPLPSGFCKDVHGQLQAQWKNDSSRGNKKTKIMQFKLTDKSLKLFPPGMSSAVL